MTSDREVGLNFRYRFTHSILCWKKYTSLLLEKDARQYLRCSTISARIVTKAEAKLQISLDPILLAKSINEDKNCYCSRI